MSRGAELAVSVVVASCSGEAMLGACLESIEAQRGDAEVIAVGAFDPAVERRLARRFPWTTWLNAASGTSVFELRARGVAGSRGRQIVVLEDHCRAAPGWLQALTSARRPAVGGAVSCGSAQGLGSFALYLAEYSALMPPLPEGPCPALLAVNAAYSREALASVEAVWREAFFDNEVHDALRASGRPPHASSAALVESRLALPLRQGCAHFFRGGRRFGGYRGRPARRLLQAPLLPLVLLGRILLRVARRRPRWLPRAVASTPLLLLLLGSWSAGEALGSLRRGAG